MAKIVVEDFKAPTMQQAIQAMAQSHLSRTEIAVKIAKAYERSVSSFPAVEQETRFVHGFAEGFVYAVTAILDGTLQIQSVQIDPPAQNEP